MAAINTYVQTAIFSLIFTGSCITIFVNIVIISLILRKRQFFLAVDRYIAVRYSLRYQMILTKKKTCFVLAAVWLFSFSISGMTWIKVSGYYKHKRNILITLAVFRVTTSAPLFTLSKYTNTIRKKHINSIEKRTKYFGVTKEKLDILKALKKSLEDSFKLYIATVFVLIAATIASVTNMLLSKNRYGFQVIMILLLQMIDVIVLAISQSDIRKALQRLFKKNRVEPLPK